MKCCICGTVKNCGQYLNKVFKNIELIGALFEDYNIIIYYDKSDDDTLNILKKYKNINPKLIFYVNLSPLSQFRTHNISKGRNICLEYIRNFYKDYEMFIMMDLDDVSCKELNIEILQHYLNINDWDSLSFNTSPTYYDLWALSIYPYYLNGFAFENHDIILTLLAKHITKKLSNLTSGELLQCASAFNGFSIYRTNKFIDCNYDGSMRLDLLPFINIFKNNNYINCKFNYKKEEDCEHRAFHFESIKKHNSRIMISSDIIFK